MNTYKCYTNKACKYFPCHKIKEEQFNCLFCYCPLYALKDKCGGNPKFLENGTKNCMDCTIVHNGEMAWDFVQSRILDIMKSGKKD